MQRRTLLQSATALAAGSIATPLLRALDPSSSVPSIPVIDTHIHLFDPERPGGVPWPEKSNTALYHRTLPDRYLGLAQPHGVVGAIAVECSSWLVDNFWLHDVVEKYSIMLGFIGDLEPGSADFAATLDRLYRSRLFLGIRYGNLWNRDLGVAVQRPEFRSGLKLLAKAELVFETANPDAALIAAIVAVSDYVPDLRIVIDHLPHADPPVDTANRAQYDAHLRELARRPTVFVKGSEIVRQTGNRTDLSPARYKAALDQLWELFGEDRILFGSDWPNSDTLATYDETFSVAAHYISTRSLSAQQKYFWKNSIAAYQWQARTSAQAHLQRS